MYGGTVSRCVDRVTPPPAREAHTFARPFATSCRVTFHPRAISQRETKSTAGPSAPVEDCRARSSAASATTSVIAQKVAGSESGCHRRPRIFGAVADASRQSDEVPVLVAVPEVPYPVDAPLVADGEMF